jgi:hypothetical protein
MHLGSGSGASRSQGQEITMTEQTMQPTQPLNDDQRFFFDHAGYGYNPATETPEQGRTRCAIALEVAERSVRNLRHAEPIAFVWEVDPDIDSSEYDDSEKPYALWQCCLMVNDTPANSLHGIDFGRDGSPIGAAYARVVEAELAAEWLADRKTA